MEKLVLSSFIKWLFKSSPAPTSSNSPDNDVSVPAVAAAGSGAASVLVAAASKMSSENEEQAPPSRFYFLCSNELSASKLKAAKKEYGNILVGFDPGMKDKPEGNSTDIIDTARDIGALLHVYFVGPTMQSWSAEEREQCKYLAESIGIDTSEDGWLDEWYSTGWEKKVQQQFKFYNDEYGCYSLEIDNLDSTTMKSDWDKYVEFFKRLDKWRKENNVSTRLMLKNIDEDGMEAIENAVKDGDLDKELFAAWGLFEAGTGDEEKQYDICKRLGIRAVTPKSGLRETHHYGVSTDGVPSLPETDDPWVGKDDTY